MARTRRPGPRTRAKPRKRSGLSSTTIVTAGGLLGVIAVVVAGALYLGVDLGGDDGGPPATPTPTVDPTGFGPPPSLGGNVLSVRPEHAERIPQAETRSPNPTDPRGVCAEVSFAGLPETGRWFHMAVDGELVTPELTWIVSSQESPEGGIMCYAPEEGLSVGRHDAAISVVDPTDANARPRQIVAWAFEVVP
ncbi:MAG: hypothetical protein Kow0010_13630 [Dehalococcoidia bacterium]